MTVLASVNRSAHQRCKAPFANAAHELREYFLCPIPVGGEDGKKPLVNWRHLKSRPSADYLDAQIRKYPNANVGILCGPSQVTVIDIDDPGIASDPQRLDEYKKRFGDTPLIIRTPSGGAHLYYQSAGERPDNLRPELPVDVKGIGSMVVVPPSIRPTGDHAGNAYEFFEGGWFDLHRLPSLKPGALEFHKNRGDRSGDIDHGRRIAKGKRNDDLFEYLLRVVRHCDDFTALLDVAYTRNAKYDPPMSDSEVNKTARSAWDYEHNPEKENWVGGPPRVVLTGGDNGILPILYQNADALALCVKLKEANAGRPGPFKIQAKAMAAKGVIPAFKKSHHRYRAARDFLLKNGLIIKVHHGKGKIWRDRELVPDPHLFTFPSTPSPKSGPNITRTPPPWGYGDD